MATSEAGLCSVALQLLGAEPIVSLTEESERARLCARFYPESRREVLALHTWNCATVRQALAQQGTGPLFGWTYAFTLPVGCLRVVATSLDRDEGGDGDPWDVETVGGIKCLVTDAGAVSIVFLDDVTNVLLFDPGLSKALAYDLAAKLAFPVTQQQNVQATYEQLRDNAIKAAKGLDGQQRSKRRYTSRYLTEVR